MLKTRMILACLSLLLMISGGLFTTPGFAQDDDDDPPVEKVTITVKATNYSSEKILVYKRVIDRTGGARDSTTWAGTPLEIEAGEESTWVFTHAKLNKDSVVTIKYFRGSNLDPETGNLLESNPATHNSKLTIWYAELR